MSTATVDHSDDAMETGPPGLELLQHFQGDATTIVEKERKLSEMILQLQLFREQLLTQQDQSNKVSFPAFFTRFQFHEISEFFIFFFI